MSTKNRLGLIGFGNMGQAIAERIKSRYQVYVFDKDKNKTKNLSGLRTTNNIADLISAVDTIILAIKPQDFNRALKDIKNLALGKLVISIAAGITTACIEKVLRQARVVRVMPNIGIKIGRAQSILCPGKSACEEDLSLARNLFDYLGKTWVMNEEMIDAATAISGSGPAYIYYDMEINGYDPKKLPKTAKKHYVQRLKKAAQSVGFDARTAFDLALSTTASSIALAASSAISPAQLRSQVTSKGGTSEAALEVLMAGGSWESAAYAAKRRAKQLSKERC